MRTFLLSFAATLLIVGTVRSLPAAESGAPSGVTLFQNVRIFNGKGADLSAPSNVLVRGNKIEKISTEPIPIERRADTLVIDGRGRTLMPGLIDAHAHTMLESVKLQVVLRSEPAYISLLAASAAQKQLLRGFTTVRDVGGNCFALKRAIDEGIAIGPRIFPSGAFISQTSGHGDFRFPTELPRESNGSLTSGERAGLYVVADGVDQVLLRSRENLMRGASQLKLMAGGGVASNNDPLDVSQYTFAEIHAAVEAAENWGTYVTVHAYTPRAVRVAINAGVKCIEHGHLLDDETAKLMAEKKIWWSLQPFLDDEDKVALPDESVNRPKFLTMVRGTDFAYRLAKKYKVRVAFGTDTVFDPSIAARQGKLLAKLVRWFEPREILKMATADNAELLAMSGPRNPYPGKLGVVEQGALADLLLVDGNPLENLALIQDPQKNFLVIMKDGKIYKNLAH